MWGRRRRRTAERMSSSITLIPRTAPLKVLHHSLTGDISCDPTLFPCYSNSVRKCTHTSIAPKKEKKSLKGAGNCKVKLSAAFHATAWQTPMVWLKRLHPPGWTKHPFVHLGGQPVSHPEQRIHATHKTCGVKWKSLCRMEGRVANSSLLLNYLSTRLWRQTVRHVKVKDWHQMKDCLKSELPKLYAHHLSCYQ